MCLFSVFKPVFPNTVSMVNGSPRPLMSFPICIVFFTPAEAQFIKDSVKAALFLPSLSALPLLSVLSCAVTLFWSLALHIIQTFTPWIWSAGLSTQLIKSSRREDRGKESPFALMGRLWPDTCWTPGIGGKSCVCLFCRLRMLKMHTYLDL